MCEDHDCQHDDAAAPKNAMSKQARSQPAPKVTKSAVKTVKSITTKIKRSAITKAKSAVTKTATKTIVVPAVTSEKTQKFIDRARKVHGDRYDYSLTVFTKAIEKVIIICRIHGPFEKRADRHINGAQEGCKRCNYKSTEQYIAEARAIHGEDTYDYSKCIYVNYRTNVIIVCRIHGEFKKVAGHHIRLRAGCPTCSKGIDTTIFIERSKEIHGVGIYDYSKVVYVSHEDKVCIVCRIHGEFWQRAGHHLNGSGCPENHRKTTDRFIEEATAIHAGFYGYTKVIYTCNSEFVIITCPIHGDFNQIPANHLKGHGCRKCAGNCPLTTEEFITRARIVHKQLYGYDEAVYTASDVNVRIRCYTHGIFPQKASSHLMGNGCPRCIGRNRTTADYIKDVQAVHGSTYDYSSLVFTKMSELVAIWCFTHGLFWQKAAAHLLGKGCRRCANVGYSKLAISWLEFKAVQQACHIQHAKNGLEFRIPSTRYSADGYAKSSNRIFEFYGDFYHGNPKLYDQTKTNVVCKKTFGELYEKTMKRKKAITDLGYGYEEIWEHEWVRAIAAVVKIQRAWRAKQTYVIKYVLVFPPKSKKIP